MYVCAKRDLLQMDCLSSEDLKEENNCSLTFNPTLNFHACPVWMCSGGRREPRSLPPYPDLQLRRAPSCLEGPALTAAFLHHRFLRLAPCIRFRAAASVAGSSP